ncbi:acyltransferase family protein, partial [Streptomyces goshikiensis]
LARPAGALLARPRVWRAVVAANGIAMTAFLWHLTAMLAVYAAQLGLGLSLPAPATAAWWAQVPLRLLAAAALTGVLVAVFRRFEAPAAGAAGVPGSGPGAALGVTCCLLGILGLSMTGLGGLLEGHSATLVALPLTAPAAIGMALGGWLLVERSGPVRRVRLRG